jgi:putative PIN family toxin of toxin-antitoxin system
VRRVVIDTNVVVSSLFGGKPREVMNRWREGALLLCLTDAIVEEYLEVLARFGDVREEAEEFFATVTTRGKVLFVDPAAVRVVEEDPDDDMFLACALAAHAEAIISGDRHLLGLGEFQGIPILGPAAFVDQMGDER